MEHSWSENQLPEYFREIFTYLKMENQVFTAFYKFWLPLQEQHGEQHLGWHLFFVFISLLHGPLGRRGLFQNCW